MSVVPSMWGVMSSWCTPTMLLFVLLNFMIAAIFVTSGFASQKQPQQPQQPQLLHRSPSMLQRLKSINFYQYANYYRYEPAAPAQDSYGYEAQMQTSQVMMPETEAASYPVMADEPSASEYEVECEAEDGFGQQSSDKSLDEVYSLLQQGSHFNWTKPDTEAAPEAAPVKKMRKSASSKAAFRHSGEEETLEARRPATVREAEANSAVEGEDEEVDSKADDFINKFKQQLKLQRLDSILRYREMLGRGAA